MKSFLSILLILLCVNLTAQHYDSLLRKLNSEYRQEKVYLQLDRAIYNSGETIFFKAYLFASNYPSQISKTLYTELLDTKGKVLQQIVSPVVLSSSAGSIDIPADVKGNVLIRSYTKWMLNFDSSYLFTKGIIVMAEASVDKTTLTPQTKITTALASSQLLFLHFFPEGGDLVQGLESRVAFKATDNRGIPIKVSGDIADSKGNKIEPFTSIHDGMGVITLIPKKDEQYKAIWKDNSGQLHQTELPAAKTNGVVLEMNNLGNQFQFKIKRSETQSSPYPFVTIVAQMNQQLLYKAKVNMLKSSLTEGYIPTTNFPAGIIQVTVFTPDEKPIAERIVFNEAEYLFPVNLIYQADSGKRKKNIIEIDVPDSLAANFSIAVTDAELTSKQTDDNIISHLLLTSDIKGYVHDPAYYFSSNADSVQENLDLVMMTNGWRRFKWEDIIVGRFPVLNYLPENYISVQGVIEGLNKKTLADKEINGILEFKDKRRAYLNTPVQRDGTFSFSGMIFYDTAKLFYQFNKDKNLALTTAAKFSFTNNSIIEPLHLQSGSKPLLDIIESNEIVDYHNTKLYQQRNDHPDNKIKTLKAVVIKTKVKTKQELMDEEYASGAFSNNPGQNSRTILPDDDPAFLASPTLLDYLQSRVAGLQVNPSLSQDAITWRGAVTALFVNEVSQGSISMSMEPGKDGKLVQDASYILSIPMSEIAMVKLFEPPFSGAWGAGPGGALAVYLKKGMGNNQTRSLNYYSVAGYSPVKEFFSPDYFVPARKDDMSDYRSTLYWNPFVMTDKKHHHISLSFYNNDITKKMKVILEGCNEDGKLIRVERIL